MSQPPYPIEPSPTPEGIGVPPPPPPPATGFPPIFAAPAQPAPIQGAGQPYAPSYTPSQPYAPSYTPNNTPGQPYNNTPSQPYIPGQPYPPAPGQPYNVGYQPPITPPKKKKIGLIVLIILLALLLAGGGLFAYWYYAIRDDGIRGGRVQDDPVVAGQATTAQAAVRGYVQALAAGNAADALSFAATPPAGSSFLTDAALAASLALNPITFQQAVREDLSTKEDIAVTADYQIGSQSVTTTYGTTLRDGYYFIDHATALIDLSDTYTSGIGMKLNGVSLDAGGRSLYLDLFPGTYQLTIGNSMLVLTGGQFVVTDPTASPSLLDTTVGLAADTPSRLADAAKATLDGCMAEASLTSSCGFGLPLVFADGTIRDVDDSTAQWSFITGSSDFSATDFHYDPQSEPTEANASIDLQIRRAVDGEGADSAYYFWICFNLSSVNVDFSDPNNMDVSFDSTSSTDCPNPHP